MWLSAAMAWRRTGEDNRPTGRSCTGVRKMSKPCDEFKRFVLDQLARVPALSSAPFFGGIGLRSGAIFFGMIMGGTLYFSTSPAAREDYQKLGSRCFSYTKKDGKIQDTKLFEVPAEVLDDAETLHVWANRAIDASTQKRKASPGRKKPAPKA